MLIDQPPRERRWQILAVLATAQLMLVLDSTIVNIALPSAQVALRFSAADRQWIVTAYSLAFGSLLLLGGRLSDLVGRRRTFLVGLLGFAAASAAGGAATSFVMLAAARAAQGAFGALLAPAALSLLATTFVDPAERRKAYGIFGAVAGSGASLGLLIGGVLTQVLSWRFCMYVNVAFAGFALLGALRLLDDETPDQRPHLDVPGAVVVSLAFLAIVYGFSHAQTAGWANPETVGLLAGGVVLLVAFVELERRVLSPLLPLSIPGDRTRGGSFLAMLIATTALSGIMFLLTFYLQRSRGYSPIVTGLAFAPMTGVVMITSVLATTRLLGRFGTRVCVTVGMLLAGSGVAVLTQVGLTTSYATRLLPGLVLVGLGLGLVFSTTISNATVGLAPSETGIASGAINASQQIGSSLGPALLSTIAASATATQIRSLHPSAASLAGAAVHGDTTAFAVSAALFGIGAIVAALCFTSQARSGERPPVIV